MALIRFSPDVDSIDALLSLQRELNRAFESPFRPDFGPSGRGVHTPISVCSDREGWVLRMEIPGVAPENVQIEAHGRTLAISGKREINPPEKGSFHRRERGSGEFSRSVQRPADLDPSRAEASYEH